MSKKAQAAKFYGFPVFPLRSLMQKAATLENVAYWDRKAKQHRLVSMRLHREALDRLVVSSGSVACGDPCTGMGKTLRYRFRKGSYAIERVVAHVGRKQQTAALVLRVCRKEVHQFKRVSVGGFANALAVDSASLAFADVVARNRLNKILDDYDDDLWPLYERIWKGTLVQGNCNVVAISSGLSDGWYPVFRGTDSNDGVCCFVVLCGLVPTYEELTNETAPQWLGRP